MLHMTCIIYIIQDTMYIIYNIHYTLCTMYIIYNVRYTLCTMYIIYNMRYSLCTMYNVLVHCTVGCSGTVSRAIFLVGFFRIFYT